MAKTLSQPATCTACRTAMPAGTRVDRGMAAGSVVTYRHASQDTCDAAKLAAPVASVDALATERQVGYALDLQTRNWTPAVFGGRRYDRGQLTVLTRTEISGVIGALESEKLEQEG